MEAASARRCGSCADRSAAMAARLAASTPAAVSPPPGPADAPGAAVGQAIEAGPRVVDQPVKDHRPGVIRPRAGRGQFVVERAEHDADLVGRRSHGRDPDGHHRADRRPVRGRGLGPGDGGCAVGHGGRQGIGARPRRSDGSRPPRLVRSPRLRRPGRSASAGGAADHDARAVAAAARAESDASSSASSTGPSAAARALTASGRAASSAAASTSGSGSPSSSDAWDRIRCISANPPARLQAVEQRGGRGHGIRQEPRRRSREDRALRPTVAPGGSADRRLRDRLPTDRSSPRPMRRPHSRASAAWSRRPGESGRLPAARRCPPRDPSPHREDPDVISILTCRRCGRRDPVWTTRQGTMES